MAAFPVIKVTGNYYDVGHQVGSSFREGIEEYVRTFRTFKSVLIPFYESARGKSIVDTLLETARHAYPHYVREIEGTAAGAQVPFIHLWLMHLESEILTLLGHKSQVATDGCTSFMIVKDNMTYLLHTEDLSAEALKCVYIIQATITEGDSIVEEFTAFAYPGLLPGTAFNINSHGMCSSLNMCFQSQLFQQGIPRRIVSRALMVAKNIPDAINIAEKSPGIAVGFNYNYAWATPDKEGHVTSLEIAGSPDGTIMDCHESQGFQYHFNEYMYLNTRISAVSDPSSKHRLRRMREILHKSSPAHLGDLLTMASDAENCEYPIFRNGAKPDYLVTAAVGVFDLTSMVWHIYRDKPSKSQPVHEYGIPAFSGNLKDGCPVSGTL